MDEHLKSMQLPGEPASVTEQNLMNAFRSLDDKEYNMFSLVTGDCLTDEDKDFLVCKMAGDNPAFVRHWIERLYEEEVRNKWFEAHK